MNDRYQRCARCVMDNASDATIRFDGNGLCNYCTKALSEIGITYFPDAEGEKKLNKMLTEIKNNGRGEKYDCIMGISGGLDSSYLLYLGYQWGLRVMAIHVDDGYDTEISQSNLKKLIQATGFDYEVIQPDAVQFNALLLAYLRAGVPNIAIPQDNVLFAFLYDKMKEYNIQYFLSGGNFALESILQQGNTHNSCDVVNIKDIHRRFGTKPIDNLKFISTMQKTKNRKLLHMKEMRPLNYIDYNRERAFQELEAFCDFKYYGRKHLENAYTAFAQLYWFPKKFGVDKRTSHLSSMIVSGQMTREEALQELSEPLYNEEIMERYIADIQEQMGISQEEFRAIMNAPTHQHTEFKTEDSSPLFRLLRAIHHANDR